MADRAYQVHSPNLTATTIFLENGPFLSLLLGVLINQSSLPWPRLAPRDVRTKDSTLVNVVLAGSAQAACERLGYWEHWISPHSTDIEQSKNISVVAGVPESVTSRLSREMTMTDQVQPACDTDQMEADVTAVIEACGGDPRTAIKALLVEQYIQEQRIERLAAALSFGYVRGRISATPIRVGTSHRETTRS